MSNPHVPFLIAGMIITGSSNSLWTKWQDMQCVENCDDPVLANRVLYEQPVWQTLQMFIGEMLCFLPLVYAFAKARLADRPIQLLADPDASLDDDENTSLLSKDTATKGREPLTGLKVLLLWLPAACDLAGTTLMNVGLLYTPVSIYQMTRGALVLFVGVLSVIFLKRHLKLVHWVSLLTVMFGVSLVGLSGSLVKDSLKESPLSFIVDFVTDPNSSIPVPEPIDQPEVTSVLVGVFFILFAQIFTATQFVIEEKIMHKHAVPPLVFVGYEGAFGTISLLLLLPVFALISKHLPPSSPYAPFLDLPRGWHQMVDNATVLGSAGVIACSIALFNWFGLSVTRHVSATARSLTDTCRTLSIWLISLGLGWERLLWPTSVLQVLGFALLVYGTFLFNGLVSPPPFLRPAVVLPEGGSVEAQAAIDREDTEEVLAETAALPSDLGRGGFDVVPHKHAQGHSDGTSTARG